MFLSGSVSAYLAVLQSHKRTMASIVTVLLFCYDELLFYVQKIETNYANEMKKEFCNAFILRTVSHSCIAEDSIGRSHCVKTQYNLCISMW